MSGANSVSRITRLTKDGATPFARARSSSVPCAPVSSIFRHRNARASALTMALLTRGRGAHAAPSGITTSFRPPRFLNVVGMWIVIVSPSSRAYPMWRQPASCRVP